MVLQGRKMNYLDFEINIAPATGREYIVSVIHSPAGEAHETIVFPYETLELNNRLQAVEVALLRSAWKRPKGTTPEEQSVMDLGMGLFDTLITGEIRSLYDVSQREAAREDMGLRLKLRIQAPELAGIPWEFIYDHRQEEFICLSRNNPVVRYLEIPQVILPLKVELPLQVLGMVVSPDDFPRLDIEREKQRVETALEQLEARGLVKITWLESPTWRDLQRALQGGPWHIFHFIGHGGFDHQTDEGQVVLADESGQSYFLNAAQLGRLLADHNSLRLVLLNSCEGARGSISDVFSSSAATLVRRGIPAVIAMQYEISDRAAIEFSRSFYESLANDLPVDASVTEARKAISMALTNTFEWGTPVLFMRAPDGTIFDLAIIRPEGVSAIASETAAIQEKHEQTYVGSDLLPTTGQAVFPVGEVQDERRDEIPISQKSDPALSPAAKWTQKKGMLFGIAAAVVVVIGIGLGSLLWFNRSPSLIPSIGMVEVEGGSYPVGPNSTMGITNFWIDRYEVTNSQYAEFIERTGNPAPDSWINGEFEPALSSYPVQGIGWETAAKYCEWAGKRLPDEAEWEAAARGPFGWLYPWGNDEDKVPRNAISTHPVGSIPTNRSYFGVYDMAGNVWEWVENPYSPRDAGEQIMHGGGSDIRYDMKTSVAGSPDNDSMIVNTGIRCAADGDRVEKVPDVTLSLDDQFKSTDTGWPMVDTDKFIFNYHPDEYYHLEGRESNKFIPVFYESEAFGSIILETDVFVDAANTDHAQGDFQYGLAIRYQEDRFYAFLISAKTKTWQVIRGVLQPGEQIGSTSDLELVAEGTENSIQGASAEDVTDRLTVFTNGTELIFFINGNYIVNLTENDYRSGNVGFLVETLDDIKKVHIHYNWVTVQKIEPFNE
jgi:hypothetical protein